MTHGKQDKHTDTVVHAGPAPLASFCRDLLSGGLSGVVSKTAAAPLERVKLLLQVRVTGMGRVRARGRARIMVRARGM